LTDQDQKPRHATPPGAAPPDATPPGAAPPDADPPDIDSDQEAARAAVQSEAALPALSWTVTLKCEAPFRHDIFMAAWKTRLPNVIAVVEPDDCDETKTVFEVVMVIKATDNVKAASRASDLLKRHFDTLKVLSMSAERSKE